eukprot:TRINITY_DN12109_c0_g1_i1.p1 TRINITY_DN12109_c0_g1~~TRINITY_DN12109_c0_g1_i1.p1  ORF type:complete len:151 (+),score=6.15 TRINITY_DN12109_c0_g1_i1:45-455(+)
MSDNQEVSANQVVRSESESDEDPAKWFNEVYRRKKAPLKKHVLTKLVQEYLEKTGDNIGTNKVTAESEDRKITSSAPTSEEAVDQLKKVLTTDLGDIFAPNCCSRKVNIALWGLIVAILGLAVNVVSLILDYTIKK